MPGFIGCKTACFSNENGRESAGSWRVDTVATEIWFVTDADASYKITGDIPGVASIPSIRLYRDKVE